MFHYKPKAITYKNINKFSYEMYTNISVNMLKYNNDSSSILRILDALNAATRELVDDLPYSNWLGLGNINFKQIDRLNKFYLDDIVGLNVERFDEDVICEDWLIGYSKYTDEHYILENVENSNDFVRHSYPCDCFFSSTVDHVSPLPLTLIQNLWMNIDLVVSDSSITIKPVGAMDSTTKSILANSITIRVEGVDIRNEYVTEDITIKYWSEYVTDNEFIFIKRIKVLDSYISFDIILYPFVSGTQVFWNEIITDREEFDRRNAIVRFNVATKSLEYSIIYDDTIEFPVPTDIVKIVKIDIPNSESIIDYFIDQQNGLFYVISKQRIFCYPFIIPQALSKILDLNKTIYQACRIDYIEDDVNEKFTFDVFPTAKANGIDSLDIYLNGELWQDGLMIDLFREKLIDNRIDIPFNDLFSKSDDCLIEFKTFGSEDSEFSVYVIKPLIKPLYVKRLNAIAAYNDSFNEPSYILPNESSTSVKYPASKITTGLMLDNSSNIYKLSKHSNIVIDGFLITDVFKTFCYSSGDFAVITHDSITHITKSVPEISTINENTSEAGMAETGSVGAGTVNNNTETTYNENSVVGLATSGNAVTGGVI